MRQAPAADSYFDDEPHYSRPAPPPQRRERAAPPIPRDEEYFERERSVPERSSKSRRKQSFMTGVLAFVKSRPADGAAMIIASALCLGVVVNLVLLQKPTKQEIVKVEPAIIPVVQAKIPEPSILDNNPISAPKTRANPVEEVQRELARRNIYQDTVDGRMGSRTQQAIREFQRQAGLKVNGEISEDLLFALRPSANISKPERANAPPKHSTLTDLVEQVQTKPEPKRVEPAPRQEGIKRLVAVQKALNQMAFGPIVTNGVMSAETRSAILRFEQDRNLPAKGEVTEKLVKQMEAVLGTRIE